MKLLNILQDILCQPEIKRVSFIVKRCMKTTFVNISRDDDNYELCGLHCACAMNQDFARFALSKFVDRMNDRYSVIFTVRDVTSIIKKIILHIFDHW